MALAQVYDAYVDAAGSIGDYTEVSDAITDTKRTTYVKTGSYSTFTQDQNQSEIIFEPGCTITGAVTLSGENASIVFGNGIDIQGVLTITGVGCFVEFENGGDIDGIDIDAASVRSYLNGGGLGTISDGGTSVQGLLLDGDDSIVENISLDTTTGSSGESACDINADRSVLSNCKIIDSEEDGITCLGTDNIMIGITMLDADVSSVLVSGPRNILIGSNLAGAVTSVSIGSLGDDSIIYGNICGKGISVNATGENCVIGGNRVLTNAIADSSGTSTVALNDQGTASCAVTGTLQSAGATESEIVSGGKTLILTLTNATWRNISTSDFATAFQTLLTGDQDGNTVGWDDVKTTILASGAMARTSDTVFTITLAAAATYNIAAGETITLADLDDTVLESESAITPDDTSYSITTV